MNRQVCNLVLVTSEDVEKFTMGKGFNENAEWEEDIGLKTTAPQRQAMRNHIEKEEMSNFNKAVLNILDDFETLKKALIEKE